MWSDRYPGLQWLGTDAFDTEINPNGHVSDGRPLVLASDSEIRQQIVQLRATMEWVKDDSRYPAKIALFEQELALREAINASVRLPAGPRPFVNLWTKTDSTWNPDTDMVVYAVTLWDQDAGNGCRWELGYGAISAPLNTPAHAIRMADYLHRQGATGAKAVACPCLYSNRESHIPIDVSEA